jgi:hypothetical protein
MEWVTPILRTWAHLIVGVSVIFVMFALVQLAVGWWYSIADRVNEKKTRMVKGK